MNFNKETNKLEPVALPDDKQISTIDKQRDLNEKVLEWFENVMLESDKKKNKEYTNNNNTISSNVYIPLFKKNRNDIKKVRDALTKADELNVEDEEEKVEEKEEEEEIVSNRSESKGEINIGTDNAAAVGNSNIESRRGNILNIILEGVKNIHCLLGEGYNLYENISYHEKYFMRQLATERDINKTHNHLSLEQKNFLLICLHWLFYDRLRLQQLVHSHRSSKNIDDKKKLKLFQENLFKFCLLGGPGTGKSTVINALVDIAGYGGLGLIGYVSVTTPTGISATVIPNATTIHKLFGWGIGAEKNKGSSFFNNRQIRNVKNRLGDTRILVIDEVSMVSQQLLYKIDLALRELYINNLDFGGIGILLCGDFFQLQPVGGTALYKPNNPKNIENKYYKKFTNYILDIQQRGYGDVQHCNNISDLRNIGKTINPVTDNMLNSLKMLNSNDCLPYSENNNSFRFAIIATASNMACAAYNKVQAIRFAKDNNVPVVAFRLPLQNPLVINIFSETYARDILYNSFDELWFYFVKDAPARTFTNLCVKYGIANGASCTLHSIVIENESKQNEFNTTYANTRGGDIIVLENPPYCVNVTMSKFFGKINSNMTLVSNDANSIDNNNTDRIVVPMFLQKKSESKNSIKYLNGFVRYYSWECGLCFASTYHKLQSLTVDKIILDLNQSPKSSLSLYHFIVGYSRVRKLDDIRIFAFKSEKGRRHLLGFTHSSEIIKWYSETFNIKPASRAFFAYNPVKQNIKRLKKNSREESKKEEKKEEINTADAIIETSTIESLGPIYYEGTYVFNDNTNTGEKTRILRSHSDAFGNSNNNSTSSPLSEDVELNMVNNNSVITKRSSSHISQKRKVTDKRRNSIRTTGRVYKDGCVFVEGVEETDPILIYDNTIINNYARQATKSWVLNNLFLDAFELKDIPGSNYNRAAEDILTAEYWPQVEYNWALFVSYINVFFRDSFRNFEHYRNAFIIRKGEYYAPDYIQEMLIGDVTNAQKYCNSSVSEADEYKQFLEAFLAFYSTQEDFKQSIDNIGHVISSVIQKFEFDRYPLGVKNAPRYTD
jgi:hypothetical protein